MIHHYLAAGFGFAPEKGHWKKQTHRGGVACFVEVGLGDRGENRDLHKVLPVRFTRGFQVKPAVAVGGDWL